MSFNESGFKKNSIQLSPLIGKLILFNEIDISSAKKSAKEKRIKTKILNNSHQYEHFLKRKARRPIYDMYASFQPFNEAVKSLYPFLKKLRSTIKKGDVILNLWDRSGWITNLLAGLFPEQEIITTWEGNKDVLGYQGYHFWTKDLNNLNILFCDLNKPLPLKNDSIAFAVGLDVYHRFDQNLLLSELLRVVQKEGSILFPHVHLSNSEPEPFFERGCKQIHGKDYQAAFKLIDPLHLKNGYVFSEPELFMANDIDYSDSISIKSAPNTKDYNALIALLPESWKDSALSAFSLKDIENPLDSRVLVNQLLNISLHEQLVKIDNSYFDGHMKSFLERHPIYLERIKQLDNYSLTEMTCKLIYLSKSAFTIKEMSEILQEKEEIILNELEHLEKLGLVQVLPISESGISLQNYLMTQEYQIDKSQENLKCLWENAIDSFPNNTALISLQDSSEYTYSDCKEILPKIIAAFKKGGLEKGDKIMICNALHVEAILLFWASMQMGLVVVPIAENLTDDTIKNILALTHSKYVFTNQKFFLERRLLFENVKMVLFDCEEDQNESFIFFADWLVEADDNYETTKNISPADEAVILFTSGSTGIPKGVQLSHGNLYRSGRLITETFHWKGSDRFFALGGLEGMSGLRNSSVASLHVGSAVVIPEESSIGNLFAITENIQSSQATILGSNPAFLRQVVKYKDKIRTQLDSITTLICTGNQLSETLRNNFKSAYNLSILNYYGLSETTGICTAQSPSHQNLNIDTIGKPVDCIAQIVDENGQLLARGETGELRIFSRNIMQGYFKAPKLTIEAIKDGWFYTQDIARFLEDGSIQLLGRKRNIVKTSTEELVYLDNIQQFISNINYVEEALVCSQRHDDNESIIAFLSLKSDFLNQAESIKIDLQKQLTEKFGVKKVPNRLIILKEMPYSNTGKILKNKLLNELI